MVIPDTGQQWTSHNVRLVNDTQEWATDLPKIEVQLKAAVPPHTHSIGTPKQSEDPLLSAYSLLRVPPEHKLQERLLAGAVLVVSEWTSPQGHSAPSGQRERP